MLCAGPSVKLVLVTADFPPMLGGVATLLGSLARSCCEHCDVFVLAPSMRDSKVFDARQPYHIIRVPGRSPFLEVRFLKRLLSLDRREGFDIIACASWFPSGLVGYALHAARKKPYLVWTYGSEIADDWRTLRRAIKSVLRPLKSVVLEKCAAIVAISRYTKSLVVSQGVSPDRVFVIPPGVDPGRFSPSGDPQVVSRYRKGARHVLLTVGRLDPHKGHANVLRALAGGLHDLGGVRYVIVGSGPEEAALRTLASTLGVTSKVEFLGDVADEDLPDVYRAADIFVMPSGVLPGRLDYVEGFGISYLEASACQKPIVAGRSGGVEDAVVDGVTGVLVDPDDVVEIGQAVRGLVLDPARAMNLGKAGRTRVLSQLSLDHFAEAVIALARSVTREGHR